MPSLDYDLRYLQAGIAVLENYLLSSEIYWPIDAHPPAGEPPYPRLTLGGLLLSRLRVHALAQSSEGFAQVAKLDEQMDAVRARWRTAWGKKAAAEFRARLKLWGNFMDDYRQAPESNVDRYAYEVQRRAQLQLLAADADDLPPAEVDLLSGLDKLLKAVFVPGGFVWDAALEPAFPQEPYWYLYGVPRGK